MDFLFDIGLVIFNISAPIACVVVAYITPQVARGVKSAKAVNKSLRSFDGTVFEPVVMSVSAGNTKAKAIKGKPVMRAIENKKDSSDLGAAYEAITSSELPEPLLKAYRNLFANISEVSRFSNLNADDQHNLTVSTSSLISSIKLFNSFGKEQKKSEEAIAQMKAQVTLLNTVVDKIKFTHNENIMRELKMNTAFLESKYSESSLEEGKI